MAFLCPLPGAQRAASEYALPSRGEQPDVCIMRRSPSSLQFPGAVIWLSLSTPYIPNYIKICRLSASFGVDSALVASSAIDREVDNDTGHHEY
jgi:hypothetical protein